MNPFLIRTVVMKGAITVAAAAMGLYLYRKYRFHRRHLLGMTTGMVLGHSLGSAAGAALAGSMGAMIGMSAGCMSGCLIGGELAMEGDKSCCEEEKTTPKTNKKAA